MILAQFAGGYSIVQLCVIAIVVISVIGILFVVMRQSGIQLPAWAIQIFWIVCLAVVAIFAIKILVSMF